MSQETVNALFTVFIIPLLSAVTVYLSKYIKLKTEELSTQVENAKVRFYMNLFSDAVQKAVLEVSQTFTDQLKKDGAFNADKQAQAFNMAKKRVYDILGETTINILSGAVKDLEAYIDSAIEGQVKASK